MHINLWEWLLFKTYMVYSTFHFIFFLLEAIFTLIFMEQQQQHHIRRGNKGWMMECDEEKKVYKKTPETKHKKSTPWLHFFSFSFSFFLYLYLN